MRSDESRGVTTEASEANGPVRVSCEFDVVAWSDAEDIAKRLGDVDDALAVLVADGADLDIADWDAKGVRHGGSVPCQGGCHKVSMRLSGGANGGGSDVMERVGC